MAVKGPAPLPYTLVSGIDFRYGIDYPPVALSGGQVVLANIKSDVFIGVLDTGVSKPHSGAHATVLMGPAVTKGRVGLATTIGDYLTIQSGWFIPGNKLQLGVVASGTLVNIGSKTAIAGLALETVASGGIATVKVFETLTFVNS